MNRMRNDGLTDALEDVRIDLIHLRGYLAGPGPMPELCLASARAQVAELLTKVEVARSATHESERPVETGRPLSATGEEPILSKEED